MRKDYKNWTFNLNRYNIHNFGLGFDYYVEIAYVPNEYISRCFMISLLFFNVTVTHWEKTDIFPGI